ncbi:MAG: GNAT family N-acetyltransferase [Pseudomonadota bacterium]
MTPIHDLSEPAHQTLLALNNANAEATSYLSPSDWSSLVNDAFWAVTTAEHQALLIALDHQARYTSPNFLWFCERYRRFVYVDRIIVGETARGGGYAQALYQELFNVARKAGHTDVMCEVNINPPNPRSDAFHHRMGFVEVGRAILKDRAKEVRYLRRAL